MWFEVNELCSGSCLVELYAWSSTLLPTDSALAAGPEWTEPLEGKPDREMRFPVLHR